MSSDDVVKPSDAEFFQILYHLSRYCIFTAVYKHSSTVCSYESAVALSNVYEVDFKYILCRKCMCRLAPIVSAGKYYNADYDQKADEL